MASGGSIDIVAIYQNWIGGRSVPARGGGTRENIDPASGELLGMFPRSGAEDVSDAVNADCEAFDAWRAMPAPRRGEILFRAGEILVRRKEEFAREMTPEMGKVLVEDGLRRLQRQAPAGPDRRGLGKLWGSAQLRRMHPHGG